MPAAQAAETLAQASPLTLKVVPTLQAAHWRSLVAVGLVVSPWPEGQVSQAAHASLPAPALKVDVGQLEHTRSLEAVPTADRYSPAAQSPPTAPQIAPSLVALKVVPALQDPHRRLDVVVGLVVWPWPRGQLAQATHASLPAAALKVDAGQLEHTRSLVTVATADRYSAAGQVPPIAAHAVSSLLVENVVPETQGAHVRSAAALPATDSPSPATQVRQAPQAEAVLPLEASNVPAAQSVHTRFDDAPGAVAW